MTEKEFGEICDFGTSNPSISVTYLDFNLTGKLVGCYEDNLLIEINGQRQVWPRELCERAKPGYPGPSYC